MDVDGSAAHADAGLDSSLSRGTGKTQVSHLSRRIPMLDHLSAVFRGGYLRKGSLFSANARLPSQVCQCVYTVAQLIVDCVSTFSEGEQ